MDIKCISCGGVKHNIIDKELSVEISEETIYALAKCHVCEECGNIYLDPGQMVCAMSKLNNKMRVESED